jgi:putative OPT family oligopeptide transporter
MRPDKVAGPSAHIIKSRFFLLFSRPFQQLLRTPDHQTGHGNRPIELTVRGLVLGIAITLLFTAANVYLGLKVGLTFASSIPAAVISMAVLRVVKSSTIEENNIVQTVASAAGTLSSIIFVLPGLVMVGWWNHFPLWSSFGICATGGVLGVMFTIPLRRAIVVDSLLPYPEGVAAAEVLKLGTGNRTGSAKETKAGFFFVIGGSLVSFGFALLAAMRLLASEAVVFFRVGPAATGCGTSLSLALFGAGHLVGLSVGLAILTGLVIAWGFATPILTVLHPLSGSAAEVAGSIWRTQVRFIGAGTIGIAAIWTLAKLAKPIWLGLLSAFKRPVHLGANNKLVARTDRDMPIHLVGTICLIAIIPLTILITGFLSGTPLHDKSIPLTVTGILFILVFGFLVAGVCGYMAGLIGSSTSPLSGVGILAIIGASIVIMIVAQPTTGTGVSSALVAFSLFVTAIVFSAAGISNDNLQDLKTGQLVNATPWRQQVALIVGVLAGALVIPPILDLLNHAYGFAGAPHGAAVSSRPLPAPQATLISELAKGVLEGRIEWGLMSVGALIGVVLIVIDEALGKAGLTRLPPLASGMGIYLPVVATAPIVLGAISGWLYQRWIARQPYAPIARRLVVLLASGLIVGESLFGVLLAGLIVITNKATPLAVVGDNFQFTALVLAGTGVVAVVAGMYTVIAQVGRWVSDMPANVEH